MVSQKFNFLYALILTLIIFNFGIFMGYMLESSRINRISQFYSESEMELLDQRLQENILDFFDVNCTSLIKENVKFADKTYKDALTIEKYETANRINSDIIFQHKRYDLLRILFWINSIKIREKCNASYHNVVYLYKYNDPSIEQGARQRFFSNLLYELKQKEGENIMLIPIAADNDLSSLNLLLDKFNIKKLPVILIDEKVQITDVENIGDIEKYLD